MNRSGVSEKTGRWSPPPELQGAMPRPVRLTGNGRVLAGLGFVLVAAAVVGGAWLEAIALRSADRLRLIEREGVSADGEVVQIRQGRDEKRKRIVTFVYDARGQQWKGSATMRRSEMPALQAGSRVPIRYLPSNPESGWMRGYEPKGAPLWAGPVVALMLGAGAAAIAMCLRRQRRLLAEGRVAEGRVTGSKRFHRGTGHTHESGYKVRYEFQTLSGATRRGSYEVSKNPPAEGTVITVLYEREEPGRNGRYPLRLVRVGAR